MNVDASISHLGEKLDEWLGKSLSTFGSQDRLAQGKTLLRGFEIAKELNRVKADGLTAINTLLSRPNSVSEGELVSSLLNGFEFGAKLADALHDELLDTDGETKVVRLMNEIASRLDATGSGRAILAVLLDHPDARVRASAGAYLLIVNLMPERVLPVLREIEEKEKGNSAYFTAHWALLGWELEGKHGKTT